MASARNTAAISFSTTLTLNETEIRALDALTGYGADSFLKVFKETCGETYIRDHEAGVKSLFEAICRDVGPALHDIQRARDDLIKAAHKRHEESLRLAADVAAKNASGLKGGGAVPKP